MRAQPTASHFINGKYVEDASGAVIDLIYAATGEKVYAAAAAQMKHVTMELGGKSPLIVFEDAILKHLAVRAEISIGDPMDEDVQMGPMASKAQLEIVRSYLAKGVEEGARLVCGGKVIEGDGYFIEPTVFAEVADVMAIAREEIFGPVMSVLDFDTEGEVIARANDTGFSLADGVFKQDITRAHRVIDELEAGTCHINTYNDAPAEAPLGGVKRSGVGRENSKAAIEHYSQMTTVYVKMGPVDDPY